MNYTFSNFIVCVNMGTLKKIINLSRINLKLYSHAIISVSGLRSLPECRINNQFKIALAAMGIKATLKGARAN
jgi:hypothetical protein